jgi:drug/metabolite transporter (DMT)-like permease
MNSLRYPLKGLLSLLAVYVIWGSTYLAIRYAVRDGSGFPPFTMAALRTVLGGLILLGIGALLRQRTRPTLKEFGLLAVSGVLLWNGGNGLVTWAEQRAHSGYAALVVGTTPIFSAIVEAVFDRRRPSWTLILSLLVGFAGLYVLTEPVLATGGRADWTATFALLAAPLSWSIGSAIQQRHPLGVSTVVSSGYQQLLGSVGFLVLLLATGEPHPHPEPAAWWAWGYLVVFGSVIGFTAFVTALRTLPVPVAMTYGYVNPVIAVFLGWLFLGEAVTPQTIAGTLLILAGVAGVFRQKYAKA